MLATDRKVMVNNIEIGISKPLNQMTPEEQEEIFNSCMAGMGTDFTDVMISDGTTQEYKYINQYNALKAPFAHIPDENNVQRKKMEKSNDIGDNSAFGTVFKSLIVYKADYDFSDVNALSADREYSIVTEIDLTKIKIKYIGHQYNSEQTEITFDEWSALTDSNKALILNGGVKYYTKNDDNTWSETFDIGVMFSSEINGIKFISNYPAVTSMREYTHTDETGAPFSYINGVVENWLIRPFYPQTPNINIAFFIPSEELENDGNYYIDTYGLKHDYQTLTQNSNWVLKRFSGYTLHTRDIYYYSIANTETLKNVLASYGLLFEVSDTLYKPVIENAFVIGYTENMDTPSEWDENKLVRDNIPSVRPVIVNDKDKIDDLNINPHIVMPCVFSDIYAMSIDDINTLKSKCDKSWFADYGEHFVSVHQLPFAIDNYYTGLNTEMFFPTAIGKTSMGTYYKLTNCLYTFDLGKYNISSAVLGLHSSFMDYEPYTEIMLYVPFCGTTKLPTNLFMNKTVSVKLTVNAITGSCVASVLCNNTLYTTLNGNISSQIPLSIENNAQLVSGMLSGISSIAGVTTGALSGSGLGTISMINSTANLAQNIMAMNSITKDFTGGTCDGALNRVMPTSCALFITTPIDATTEKYKNTTGYACEFDSSINQLKGFTVVENVDMTGITASAQIKNMIKTTLESGFYA